MARLIFESDATPQPECPPSLQYEGGDIIFALTPDPKEDLLAHSSILNKKSSFFNGSKAIWAGNTARIVQRPATDAELAANSKERSKDMVIPTYYLVKAAGDIIMLETAPPTDRRTLDLLVDGNISLSSLYLSDLAHGFVGRVDDSKFVSAEKEVPRSRLAHRILIGLVYQEEMDLDQLDYTGLANLVALAELYDLIELVAPAIREHLLSLSGIWKDVRDEHQFHLALSIKLRCETIYYDALRHLIGSGGDISGLVNMLDIDPEIAFNIYRKRDELRQTEAGLLSQLQSCTMATYIPHAGRSKHINEIVATTHAASRIEHTLQDQVVKHAHMVILETFTFHLCGHTHWSHVREYKDFQSGVYSRSSLRNFCNALVQAMQTGTELELFAPTATSDVAFAELFETDHKGSDQKEYAKVAVQDEIMRVVSQMANIALPYIVAPDFKPIEVCAGADEHKTEDEDENQHYGGSYGRSRFSTRGRMRGGIRGRGNLIGRARRDAEHWTGGERHNVKTLKREFKRVGMTAKNDTECHYFTCIDFGDEDFRSWTEDFEGYQLEGIEDVSEEWAQLVGLGVDRLGTPTGASSANGS